MENGSFIVDLFCQNDDVPLCKRLPEGNLFEVMVVHDLDDWGGTPVTGWKPHHHLSSNKKSHVYPFSTISIAMLNNWKNIHNHYPQFNLGRNIKCHDHTPSLEWWSLWVTISELLVSGCWITTIYPWELVLIPLEKAQKSLHLLPQSSGKMIRCIIWMVA